MATKPDSGERPQYGQLYFVDTEESVPIRLQERFNIGIDKELCKEIENTLRIINPFIKAYEMMGEIEKKESLKYQEKNKNLPEVKLLFSLKNSLSRHDRHRYNIPFENEVIYILNKTKIFEYYHKNSH